MPANEAGPGIVALRKWRVVCGPGRRIARPADHLGVEKDPRRVALRSVDSGREGGRQRWKSGFRRALGPRRLERARCFEAGAGPVTIRIG
ncbi:MAG: hypothetical protein EA377_09275 [Phycisphaerales bacterium]|nr:MAG: hypothetical protein EA377_09275 [Phycisphaerales bacterium]